jgi:hypothetical protein
MAALLCAAGFSQQPRIWDMVHDRLDPGCGVEAYSCRLELLVIGFTIV